MNGEHGALNRANAVASTGTAGPFWPRFPASNRPGVVGKAGSVAEPANGALMFMRGPRHVSPAGSAKSGTPAARQTPPMIPTVTTSARRSAVR